MSDWIFKKSGEIIVLDAKTGILGRFFFFFLNTHDCISNNHVTQNLYFNQPGKSV